MFLAFIQFFKSIETKPNLVKRTFEDVYGQNYNPTNYTGIEYNGTGINANAENVYVYYCVFRYCTSSTESTAIC